MIHIKADKGVPNAYIFNNEIKTKLRMRDVREILKCDDLHIFGYYGVNYICCRKDCKEYDNWGPNEVASFLVKEPVYGPCVIVDPEEVCPHENWMHESRRSLPRNRSCDEVCEGKGVDSSGRETRKGKE